MLSRRDYLVLYKCRKPYKPQTDEERAQINALYKAGLVIGHGQEIAPGGMLQIKAWVVTNAGLNALEEFEIRAGEKAKEEKQKRFDNKIAVANLAVAILSFLAGLLIEFFLGPLETIWRQFAP